MEVLQSINARHIATYIGDPNRSVDLTRDLIWAEAGRQIVDFTKISISSKIYSKDGGVDGTTIDIKPQREIGLLTKGKTYFQIKWGTSFNARKENHLKKELIEKNKLKKSLQDLAKDGGRYVLVWFGDAFKGQQKEECLQTLQDIFRAHKAPKMKISVLDQDDIAQFCNLHPVILSRYFVPLSQYFLTIDAWKDRFWKDSHEKNVELMLRNNRSTVFTLLKANNISPYQPVQLISHDEEQYFQNKAIVYKVLSSEGLNQRTICVDAEKFGPPLSTTIESLHDLNQIIVIDKCKKEHHEKLLDILGQRNRRLNMIILSVDGNVIQNQSFAKIGWHGSEHSAFLQEIEKSKSDEKIGSSALYLDPKIPQLQKATLPNHMEVTYSEIAKKYGFNTLANAKRILRYLALFSSIGSEHNRTKELEFLANNAGFNKNQWSDFAETIHILREFGLIQGEYYIKISGQTHRQFLIQEWWEIYGPSFDFNEFLTNTYAFSEHLAARLIDSLSYVSSTEKGREIARVLLGEHGIFSSGKLFHDVFGTRLFSRLTEADPEAALDCLRRTIGGWSIEDLEKYDSRRDVIFALEKISWWQDLFDGAAALLLNLGEAETEHSIANNASGIFAGLFSPGYGRVASTETPPLKRLPIIRKIIQTGSEKKISLALRACTTALESTHFTRFIAGEGPSYGREFRPWMPKTYGEIFDYYRGVWELLEENIGKLKGDLRNQAVDILVDRARGLSRIQNLTDMVITTLDKLAKNPEIDKEKIVDCIATIIRFEAKSLTKDDIKKLQKIDEFIMGTDYHSKLKRFVGMRLRFEFDDKDDKPKLNELAEEGMKNSLLKNEIKWLVKTGAKKAHRFGYFVGKNDPDFSLLETIIDEQQNTVEVERDLSFLGSYCSAIFEANPDRCDKVLDKLSRSKKTVQWVPYLLYASRINLRDKDLIRLIQLAEKKKIKLSEFNRLYLGGVTRAISEKIFLKMCSLLKSNAERYLTLLQLYDQYFHYTHQSSKLPQKFTLSILTSKFVIKKSVQYGFDMSMFSYAQIAKRFVSQYPKDGLTLIQKYLDEGNSEDSFIAKSQSEFDEILTELTKKNSDQVWDLIKNYLGPPIDIVAYILRNWLRSSNLFERGDGAIVLFNHNTVFKWVDENPQERSTLLAYVVPSTLVKNNLSICWAREVLVKYGSSINVRRELTANFSTEGFSGSEVEHYEKKKSTLVKIRETETDPNVLRWVDEYEVSLNYDIERGKRFEESFEP